MLNINNNNINLTNEGKYFSIINYQRSDISPVGDDEAQKF